MSQRENRKTIVLVAGGTLGHVYPLLALAKALKDNYNLYFFGTTKGLEKQIIDNYDYFIDKYYFDVQGFKRKISFNFLKYNIQTIIKYNQCSIKCKKILENLAPAVVIGFGGYISGTVVKCAQKLKVKTILHEQNTIMGLANKIVQKKANLVVLSFPIPKYHNQQNFILLGNPRISETLNYYQANNEEKKTLLVTSGSLGATLINDMIIKISPLLLNNGYKIYLVCGKRYYESHLKQINAVKSKNFIILDFTNEMLNLLKIASVVIARSGATTLNEILAMRKICCFIPSPNVVKNHQEINAKYLVDLNCSKMILEKDLTSDNLFAMIEELENNQELRINMHTNMINATPYDCLKLFVNEVKRICED